VWEAAAGIFTLAGAEDARPVQDGFAQPGDVALVLHTSGTTSRPKSVPLTQTNLCASAQNIAATLALTESDRCLNIMPLFHIHGLVGALLSSLTAGGSVVCTSGFDPENFFPWLEEFSPTWYTAVHTMHQAVLSRAQANGKTTGSSPLRFIRSSSTALPLRVMRQLEEIFHIPVIESYGMTEAAHQITSNPLPPGQRKPGSVGVATGPEVAIMDDAGNFLPPLQIGEIVIRGVSVMSGYENSGANRSDFTNGWLRTGDQGFLDAEGYLFLTGRLKEIINRGGEKISPNEIDQALMDHPDICQAATFAAPHPSLGEDVAAAVVLRQDIRLTESAIREYLLGRLADFKVPAKVWIVDEIPKGSTGKIQRAALAEKFAEQLKRNFVPPRTPLEAIIAAIYAEVLNLERVGADGNFFALGGDSLRAMQVMSRIRTALQVNLTIATLFRNVVVADLAEVIAGSAQSVDSSVMAEILSEVKDLSDEAAEDLLAADLDPDQCAN
jgi:acyl-CoA synthetase (AMP-forming)/AMP-acid ligase II